MIISTLFFDGASYDVFPRTIKPLYCDAPKRLDFVNDSQQYEIRFMIMLYLQYEITVEIATQLATELNPPTIYNEG